MSSLIPEPKVISQDEKGKTVWEYRGAEIDQWGQNLFGLRMPGHPVDGAKGYGNMSIVVRLVDHWLDHQALPAPYVWPPRG